MSQNESNSQEVYDCPSCDYTTKSKAGIGIHHKHKHGESLSWQEYDCVCCGETVERRRCNVGDIVYCSDECEAKYKSERPPEEHPRWKGREKVECCICGEEKQVPLRRLDDAEEFLCGSDECFSEWSSNRDPWNKGTGTLIDIVCDQCGCEATKTPQKYKRDDHHFCSKECHNQWMSENQYGPNHHQWTGGRRDYGPGWSDHTKRQIRESQQHNCFKCGISQQDAKSKYDRKLHVHHLVEPNEKTNPAVHNAERNLVALCVSCHMSLEQRNSVVQSLWLTMEINKS